MSTTTSPRGTSSAGTRFPRRFLRLPDSLFGQLLCLLAFGIVLLQAANFVVVCSVQHLYIRQAEKSQAEQLVSYWFLFDALSPAQREATIRRMAQAHTPGKAREKLELVQSRPDWEDCTHAVERLLRTVEHRFGGTAGDRPVVVARAHDSAEGLFRIHLPAIDTAVQLQDGTWLKVTQPYPVDDRKVVYLQRLLVLLEGVVLLVCIALLLRRLTRPLSCLRQAAEKFGKNPELSDPCPEQGVREIREVAQSFNRMRERICGNFAERDRMIAAMAHDLRTPLTRLQLRLDRVEPEDLRNRLQETAFEIGGIISQGLEFARSLNTDEPMTRLDMQAFLQSLADDHADVGHDVALQDASGQESGQDTGLVIVSARPLCLRRCLDNLISNACKYGGSARLALAREGDSIVVSVLDRGPGIPQDKMALVFEPYFRLDASRNRLSGGMGLGLAIARNMALLNNAELELRNRPEGGLEARVLLPAEQTGRVGRQ